MKFLRSLLFTTALTAGAGFVVYRFVLNDEARAGVREASNTVRDSYRKVNEVVEDVTGLVVEEDTEELPNRTKTIEDWKKLGY